MKDRRRSRREATWRRAAVVLSCVLVISGSACAPAGAAVAPEVSVDAPPGGDELFASGAYAEAIEAYGQELGGANLPDERARLHLFRALARLAEGDARGEGEAIVELRAVEMQYGTSLWGRVARIYVLELTRRDALREALMQAGAELREAQTELQTLEHRLMAAQALSEDQERSLASLKDERKKLQRQLDSITEQAQSQTERIQELQRELEALKQIDMRRKP
mgnify:CR=1 FL=1